VNERDSREYPARPIVGVGAVVYVTPGDAAALGLPSAGVILVRRGHPPLAGEWSLPGGTLEVGETLAAAIAREVAEEIGLSVRVGPVIEVLDRIMRDAQERVQYHFVLVDYLCRPAGGTLRAGSDAADIAIADPAALAPFRLTDKAASVIARGVEMARDSATRGSDLVFQHSRNVGIQDLTQIGSDPKRDGG
jgi:8-oxo-dGTP diphosphatase